MANAPKVESFAAQNSQTLSASPTKPKGVSAAKDDALSQRSKSTKDQKSLVDRLANPINRRVNNQSAAGQALDSKSQKSEVSKKSVSKQQQKALVDRLAAPNGRRLRGTQAGVS